MSSCLNSLSDNVVKVVSDDKGDTSRTSPAVELKAKVVKDVSEESGDKSSRSLGNWRDKDDNAVSEDSGDQVTLTCSFTNKVVILGRKDRNDTSSMGSSRSRTNVFNSVSSDRHDSPLTTGALASMHSWSSRASNAVRGDRNARSFMAVESRYKSFNRTSDDRDDVAVRPSAHRLNVFKLVRDDSGDTSTSSQSCNSRLVKEARDDRGDTSLSSLQLVRSKLVKEVMDDRGDTSSS